MVAAYLELISYELPYSNVVRVEKLSREISQGVRKLAWTLVYIKKIYISFWFRHFSSSRYSLV